MLLLPAVQKPWKSQYICAITSLYTDFSEFLPRCLVHVGLWEVWCAGALGQAKLQAFSKETFSKGDRAQGDVRIILAACGARHMAALTATGELWVWGRGASGQLGFLTDLQPPEDLLAPPCAATYMGGGRVAMVSCGANTTAAVTCDGTLYAWGEGSHGKLGLGHQRGVGVSTGVPSLVRTDARVGRFRKLSVAKMIAFAIISHPRLGLSSVLSALIPELVERIVEATHAWPQGTVGGAASVGCAMWGGGLSGGAIQTPLVRLLGGGVEESPRD